ncbi:hypothetical protein M440DRAFT_1065040 [Trichoderma longibrachiatum ATCC 18648]|uniref:Uncharacterized protein n=1 Tax=Trichoderma longibrachiatum ATCC 18648 TaxID=983965 RepID=A0A2T4BW70_TRILO|nr:hypothetical protein M440DRAFT_1065040 [Trichoderma longibrachiatum ATCC 18648]
MRNASEPRPTGDAQSRFMQPFWCQPDRDKGSSFGHVIALSRWTVFLPLRSRCGAWLRLIKINHQGPCSFCPEASMERGHIMQRSPWIATNVGDEARSRGGSVLALCSYSGRRLAITAARMMALPLISRRRTNHARTNIGRQHKDEKQRGKKQKAKAAAYRAVLGPKPKEAAPANTCTTCLPRSTYADGLRHAFLGYGHR